MGQPRPLFRLFSIVLNKHHYIFYNKYVWKNVHESIPITTRPGLPPSSKRSYLLQVWTKLCMVFQPVADEPIQTNFVQTDDELKMKKFKMLNCNSHAASCSSSNSNTDSVVNQQHQSSPRVYCVRYCQEIEDLKLESSQNQEILEEILSKSGFRHFLMLQFLLILETSFHPVLYVKADSMYNCM